MHGIHGVTAMGAIAAHGAPQPRLVRAAHEFEGQMMKELFKPMTGDDALAQDEDQDRDGSAGALGEFASESLGRALSDRGGLGIATSILKSLSQLGHLANSAKVTANQHEDTEVSASK
jgi:Rod binding domain-containing protein